MKTAMLFFSAQSEVVKICHLVNGLKTREGIRPVLCVTDRQRQRCSMPPLIASDCDLSIMKDKQTLPDITINILNDVDEVPNEVKPDGVLAHGMWPPPFFTALACFYKQIPVGHV